jgi:hypothetical protein
MSGYTKLFSSILQSTVWQEPSSTKVVWITMLALAGKTGVVEGSIPGLAHTAGVTIDECEEALRKFQFPDPYSRSKDFEGRRVAEVDGGWMVLNHGKYRELLSKDNEAEANARRQKRYREKNSHNNGNVTVRNGSVTQNNAIPDPSSDASSSPTPTTPQRSKISVIATGAEPKKTLGFAQVAEPLELSSPEIIPPAAVPPPPAPDSGGGEQTEAFAIDAELPPSPVPDEPETFPEGVGPPVVTMQCVGTTRKEFTVRESLAAEWAAAYPGVDVPRELKRAAQWAADNPTKRKTFRGARRYFSAWLARAQDGGNGGRVNAGKGSAQPVGKFDAYCGRIDFLTGKRLDGEGFDGDGIYGEKQ